MNFKEIGYPRAKHYTNPSPMVDFAVYSNEDIGLTSSIAADDAYEFALPYPSDVDIDEEALIVDWIDFLNIRNDQVDLNGNLTVEALDILFSMLDHDYSTSNPMNQLDDTNQIELKKTFDGPYHWRLESALLEDDNGTPASHEVVNSDQINFSNGTNLLRWIPFQPLDLPLPMFIALTNRSKTFTTIDLQTATSDAALAQASTEFIAMRVWYRKRKLTSAEKSLRGQARLQRLGA